ncbi:hypothetical protein A9G09_05780 [Gilliamella sp. wkB292]|uniref:hypothetical protein n=1 Tax=unclassified Gilliamella TaxID=2685620 RepID=UPI00080ED33A|nr:hypothetical protein [Gilliamella apicola]OCG14308.1 hypothetical protein A9G09_05780 [Gilliamella apicola]OCL24618.1 hypothetical protein A9G03_04415 [Gilliamella apicola]
MFRIKDFHIYSKYSICKLFITKKKLVFLFFTHFAVNIFNQLLLQLSFKRIVIFNKKICLTFKSNLYIIGIHFLFILFSPYTEALSNITVKTIVGSAPYLQLKSDQDGNVGTKIKGLNELLGFRMPTTENNNALKFVDVSESLSFGGKPLQVPEGTKFSDIITMVPANGQANALSQFNNVGDDDGDASLTENTTIEGTLTATWYDNNNVINDLSREFNVCGGPYFLKIGAQNVAVSTKYGQPNKNIYGSQPVITYQFMLEGAPKLCFVQPGMNVYKNSSYMTKYPNGYNPEVWDSGTSRSSTYQRGGGFKAEQFKPITGFKYITFKLIGSGADQSQYRCQLDSSNSINWVTLHSSVASEGLGANCYVRYDSVTKPTTPLTINMEYTADKGKTWQNIGKITLPIPQKWAIIPTKVKGFLDDDSYTAYDECRRLIDGQTIPKTTSAQVNDMSEAGKAWRQKYLYRRDELTNSLQANTLEWTAKLIDNAKKYTYSRDLGTFLSEWGTQGLGGHLWTAEMYRTNKPFSVRGHPSSDSLGSVLDDGFSLAQNQSAHIFCRGENGISALPTR